MRRILLPTALALLALALLGGLHADPPTPVVVREAPAAPAGLIVHEWGTFTQFAGSDGGYLDFRPLVGEDLPNFVYAVGGKTRTGLRRPVCGCGGCVDETPHGCCGNGKRSERCACKLCAAASVRMETPVLYFYADRKQKIRVKVDFPRGRVTEWYPQALSVGAGIDWGTILLDPTARPTLPHDGSRSHYYPARDVDAAPVRVCGANGDQWERFLFYRGVADFTLPLRLRALGDDRFRIDNRGAALPGALLLEVRDGAARVTRLPALGTGETDVRLPDEPTTVDDMGRLVATEPARAGLYGKEARAMVATWRESWFAEDGTRLLYILPTARTEAILPLQVHPRPIETVRVLVGRVEVLTPEREREVADAVAGLSARRYADRELASAALRKLGRFAEPALVRVRQTSLDPEVRRRAALLLERLRPIARK